MNEYITFDGNKYRTTHKTWKPAILPLVSSRILLDAELDATWGPATLYLFAGEIKADVTPDAGYGDINALRTTLAKRQKLTLIDHYSNTYSVVAIGPFSERGLSPKWDSPSNAIYVTVQFKGILIP